MFTILQMLHRNTIGHNPFIYVFRNSLLRIHPPLSPFGRWHTDIPGLRDPGGLESRPVIDLNISALLCVCVFFFLSQALTHRNSHSRYRCQSSNQRQNQTEPNWTHTVRRLWIAKRVSNLIVAKFPSPNRPCHPPLCNQPKRFLCSSMPTGSRTLRKISNTQLGVCEAIQE